MAALVQVWPMTDLARVPDFMELKDAVQTTERRQRLIQGGQKEAHSCSYGT